MEITHLEQYREEKKVKRFVEDINNILVVIETAMKAFHFFRHYAAVQEILGNLEANRKMFLIQKNKYTNNVLPLKKS